MERQQKVWKIFDERLNENDRARIAVILTFTPLEKKRIFDDEFDAFDEPMKRKSISASTTTTVRHVRNGAGNRRRLAGNGGVASKVR